MLPRKLSSSLQGATGGGHDHVMRTPPALQTPGSHGQLGSEPNQDTSPLPPQTVCLTAVQFIHVLIMALQIWPVRCSAAPLEFTQHHHHTCTALQPYSFLVVCIMIVTCHVWAVCGLHCMYRVSGLPYMAALPQNVYMQTFQLSSAMQGLLSWACVPA